MDREKVIKAYECCGNPFNRKCEKCPYEEDCCHDGIPMFVIRKMVELLKAQEAEIRQLRLALNIAKGTCKGIKSGASQFADMPTIQSMI